MRDCLASFPAPAGYQILFLSDRIIFDRQPVVGFLVVQNEYLNLAVLPVIPDKVLTEPLLQEAERDWYAMLYPDGHVEGLGASYPSIDAFEESMAEINAEIERMKLRNKLEQGIDA
jgi:hypothetical protein